MSWWFNANFIHIQEEEQLDKMEDDTFLRCLEANLLSDMALQGIEQIAKVGASWLVSQHTNTHTSKCTFLCFQVHVYTPTHPGVHALPNSGLQEEDHRQWRGRIQGSSGVDPWDGRCEPDEGAQWTLCWSRQDNVQSYRRDILSMCVSMDWNIQYFRLNYSLAVHHEYIHQTSIMYIFTSWIYSSFLHILQVLGIEAVRKAVEKELYHVISFDGSYVNYRHLALLCDVMCCRGHLMAVTRHGINRQECWTTHEVLLWRNSECVCVCVYRYAYTHWTHTCVHIPLLFFSTLFIFQLLMDCLHY